MRHAIEIKPLLLRAEESTEAGGKLGDSMLRRIFCSVCAATGIFGGLASLTIGLACVVVHAVFVEDRVFDKVGSVLLIVAIPMLLAGSIFLDEIPSK